MRGLTSPLTFAYTKNRRTLYIGIMKYTQLLVIGFLFWLISCSDGKIITELPDTPEPPEIPETSEKPGENVTVPLKRLLWASINGRLDATASAFAGNNNKILVSWRLFPTDNEQTAFDLYRKSGGGEEVKVNSKPIVSTTNYQDVDADCYQDNTYRLCYSGDIETLDSYTITARQASEGLPYISIPLQSTLSLDPSMVYLANDASVEIWTVTVNMRLS